MPTYDYRCYACDHRFQKEQRITDKPGAECPECKSTDCHREISAPSFHLKGGGWFGDGYSKKGK